MQAKLGKKSSFRVVIRFLKKRDNILYQWNTETFYIENVTYEEITDNGILKKDIIDKMFSIGCLESEDFIGFDKVTCGIYDMGVQNGLQ